MEPGGLQKEKGPKAQDRKRRAGRDDVVRSCLPSSLALYWKLESKLVQKFKQQVRAADQAAYPEVTIESFVGHSSMGLLCPPAHGKTKQLNSIQKNPCDYKGHTHTPQSPKFFKALRLFQSCGLPRRPPHPNLTKPRCTTPGL